MNRLWSFLKRCSGLAGASSPVQSAEPVAAGAAEPVERSRPESASKASTGTVAAATPEPEPPAEPEPLRADELDLPSELADALQNAVASGARGVLVDPEEFDCLIYIIAQGAMEQVGTCSLEAYESARRTLKMLEGRVMREGERTYMCQLSHTLSDLGQRTIVGFLPFHGSDSILAEFRKGNVRLVNRLRPGTTLTRHNREQILRMLARAGERPAPTFVERLVREGLVDAEAAQGDDSLDRVVRNEALARKAVARVLGEYLGIGWVDVEENLPDRDVAQLLTREQVISWEALPSEDLGDRLVVAMADPFDPEGTERVRTQLGRPIDFRLAAGTDIRVAAEKLFRYH